ncbi:UNVERIFIED_CONTAM: hypothetical protein PYX00_008670 [Menopon gallinae]
MLDTNKDGLKLEAMKRIIGMVAKGRDASDLFPAVVKNVVSKNLEVKKLVFVYLVRYAEEQQDLALLSISTFQRALKDPNQLIRASALRVLSSIRVPMIVPIVMLAIKDSASDMSPYVRKTAAHAIPKLYSLDPEQKEDLIQLIEKLLSDKTTLVVGSAVMAFEEVCPERIDLIHKNYRKLCNLLMDVDEWGQVIILNMLTRYARTQFTDPNVNATEEDNENQPFYEETDSEDEKKSKSKKKDVTLDPDLRLLLRESRPLLQSRNAAVVMGVAQLYHHLAPRSEVIIVAKALIRLLRCRREVQSVVLNCIASLSTQRKGMFEPFLQSFFVRTSDPTHIKLLKLEILTNLGNEVNIGVVLREFQTYISSNDKVFVAAAIQAIGRCAANIKEVTDSCLTGLVSLLSNRDEAVVAESVVVIKKLLQSQPEEHQEIISHMAKLMDHITVPQARASILWLLGEYSERVPKIAPDVLRKMAKTFIIEEDIVKQQVLNLAVKLYLTNPSQVNLLCQYVFSLARYDQNYDLRDRARFLRQFIFRNSSTPTKLEKCAKKIFLAPKPAPVLESKYKGREQFQLGSLSHYIDSRSNGYHELPPFPEVAPDPSVRNVEISVEPTENPKYKNRSKTVKKKSFYSESEQSSSVDESSEASSDEESSDEENAEDEEEEDEDEEGEEEEDDEEYDDDDDDDDDDDEDEEEDEDEDENVTHSIGESEDYSSEKGSSRDDRPHIKKDKKSKVDVSKRKSFEEDSSDEGSEDDEEDDSEVDSASEKTNKNSKKINSSKAKEKEKPEAKPPGKSNLDLLLELDDVVSSVTPVLTPSLGGFLTPVNPVGPVPAMTVQPTGPSFIPYKAIDLVNKLSGGGLSIQYRYTRSPHLYSPKMISVELIFTNHGPDDVKEIKMGSKESVGGITIHDFAPISVLSVNCKQSCIIGVDLNDSTQPVQFTVLTSSGRSIKISFKTPIGEMIRPVVMPEVLFNSERSKLKGMNEHSCEVKILPGTDSRTISQKVLEAVNVGPIPSTEPNYLRFAGETVSSKSLVLVTICQTDEKIDVYVNCEKMVIGSMLLNELKVCLRP